MLKINIVKKAIIIFVIIISGAVGIYFYAYKSHRDISTEQPDFTLSLSQLQNDFNSNDSLFNAKYADKTLQIYGKITSLDLQNKAIMVDEHISISCIDALPSNFIVSDSVSVKGRYVGYDDLLEEFKIDQAIITKK